LAQQRRAAGAAALVSDTALSRALAQRRASSSGAKTGALANGA
jgi:hypothetical protein